MAGENIERLPNENAFRTCYIFSLIFLLLINDAWNLINLKGMYAYTQL